MTCIVGVSTEGGVYIGADSFASDSFTGLRINYPKKVFQSGEFIIGVCGSIKLIQTLTHKLGVMPRFVDQEIYDYVYGNFYESLVTCLRQEKCLTELNGNEYLISGSEILVGIEDKLFIIQADLSMLEPSDNYACVGSGEYHSQAVMEVLKETKLSPAEKIVKAIQATNKHVLSVNEDVIIVTNDTESEIPEGLSETDSDGEEIIEKPKRKRGRPRKKKEEDNK